MGEVVPARTSPPYLPHPLALCCNYPVSKCPSASIVVTSTLRVNYFQWFVRECVTLATIFKILLLTVTFELKHLG